MRVGRRPARRLLTAGAVVLAVALGAAGCGGGVEKSNTYVDQVNLAQTQFASSFTRLSREITASSTAAHDRKTLRAIQGSITKTVTDLRAIHPPDKVKSLHGDLVDAIAGYGAAIGTAEQNLSGTVAEATRAQGQLATDTGRASAQVTAAISAINQKLRQ
jgi:hypothetical protein